MELPEVILSCMAIGLLLVFWIGYQLHINSRTYGEDKTYMINRILNNGENL